MQAIILAGGFGTRLQTIVSDVPKPMADISGKPFLGYLLTNLQNHGFKKIVISTGYLQEKIISYFGNSYLGMEVLYAKEEEALGTGGAIKNSLQFIDKTKPVVVLNGDSFLRVDYKKLFAAHKKNLTIVLRKMDDCSRYGRVVFDENLIVKNFEEKPRNECEATSKGFINGGIYVFDATIFDKFSLPKKFSFETDFLMKELKVLEVQGFLSEGYFIDIGIPDDYFRAKKELPNLLNRPRNKCGVTMLQDNIQVYHPALVAGSSKNKALFLDRDGVINVDYGHVFEKEKFHFIEGIFDLCLRAQELGYLIIVVTNQAGIAKGFYSEEQFLKLTKWMENEFEKRGIKITKTFYCPFHIEGKIEKYRQDSFDRKPNPGMILKAIVEFNIDPKKSVMIGDKESDMLAAKKAGIGLKVFFGEDEVVENIADIKTNDLKKFCSNL